MAPTKHSIRDLIILGLVELVTLPYHRFFTYNTLKPAQEIQRYAASGVHQLSPDRPRLYQVLAAWRDRKQHELKFVTVAAMALTAIVTASFSWPSIAAAYWVGPAFWYASLITSVCGILLAAQQQALLSLVGDLPAGAGPRGPPAAVMKRHLSQILADRGSGRWTLSWKLLFTWQCPMMYVGYAFVYYFIGLTVVVCSPLIFQPWGTESYVAVAYIVATALSWGMFAYCSLAGYQPIAICDDDDAEAGDGTDVTRMQTEILTEQEKTVR